MTDVKPQVMSLSTLMRMMQSERFVRRLHRVFAGEGFDKELRAAVPGAFYKNVLNIETVFGVPYAVNSAQPSDLATIWLKRITCQNFT